jgi:signal peptidase I
MLDSVDQDTRLTIWKIIAPIVIVLVLFLWFQAVFQSVVVNGASMETNLDQGQVVLINKAAYWFGGPKRGDIIVFRAPEGARLEGESYIKRVIGLPGENVTITNGYVYINGALLLEPDSILKDHSSYPPKIVPEGHYYVLGDNRGNSEDSRHNWTVPRGNIIGKAWLSIWPLSKWGFAPNYSLELEVE